MKILDLFCGAGGASKGYHDAGFEVIGIDINPQPHYPYEFVQRDIFQLSEGMLSWIKNSFDLIHASPPCQAYSRMAKCNPDRQYPDLIPATRYFLQGSKLPYVIENVEGAPLIDPVLFCGQSFGLDLYRHRLFETNWPLIHPYHFEHIIPASKAGHWQPGTIMSVAGHFAPMWKAKEVMGIDWMNRKEMAEAIPPAFTEHIGLEFLKWQKGMF